MEKISDYKNNCVLVAIKEVTGKADAEIFAAVRRHNYKNNQGMYQDDYLKACRELGLEMSGPNYANNLFPDRYQTTYDENGYYKRLARITLSSVLKKLTKGTFFVRVPSHLLVVRDGKLVDTNYYRPKLGRSVIDYVEIKNAHQAPKTGFLKVARRNSRKFGTSAYRIGQQAFDYIQKNPKATKADVLANCPGYKSNWLAWDMKRGNIIEG